MRVNVYIVGSDIDDDMLRQLKPEAEKVGSKGNVKKIVADFE